MNDRISVIIPAYNSAAHLPAAVASVRAQRWGALEIVVVDDGSTDGTQDVLRCLAGRDLKVLRQENRGPAAARNTGIASSNGRWIAFLDADDLWVENKLARQMEGMARNAAAGFCCAGAVYRRPGSGDSIQRARRLCGALFLDLLFAPEFGTGSVLVNRECLDRVGHFDARLRTGEDWDLWLRLAAVYPGCYIPETLAVYRVGSDARKYSPDLLERCTRMVIDGVFARPETATLWPRAAASRSMLYSWHYSVLAKSHLQQGNCASFCRLALASVASHPAGALFLFRRWKHEIPELAVGRLRCAAPRRSGILPRVWSGAAPPSCS